MSARDTEAYTGELAMLRGVLGVVRVIAQHGDIDELRRVVAEHFADERAAHAEQEEKDTRGGESTPQFFQAGRTYRARRCADLRFECLAVTTVPGECKPQAVGWRFGPLRNGVRTLKLAALGAYDWSCCDWAEITDATTTEGTPNV